MWQSCWQSYTSRCLRFWLTFPLTLLSQGFPQAQNTRCVYWWWEMHVCCPGQMSVLPPCQSDQFCNQGIFQDFGHGCEPTLEQVGSLPLPSPLILSHHLPSPLPPSLTYPFPSLRSRPFKSIWRPAGVL